MSVRCTRAVLNYPYKDVAFKAVMFALGDFANYRTMRAWPSLATLVDASGAGRSTVVRKLDLAVELGIITRDTRRDMSTVYTFDKDFIDRFSKDSDEEEERAAYRHSAKQVNPEPDFFDVMEASATAGRGEKSASPTAGLASARAGGASPRAGLEQEEEQEEEQELDSSGGAIAIVKESTAEQFIRRWNALADRYRIAHCVAFDDNMRRKLLARLDGFSARDVEPCEVMDNFFRAIERSPFLRGEVPPSGGRKLPFRLSVAWALAPTNFAKIYNNTYDGDRDAAGNDISGPKAIAPTAAAAASARARFQSRGQQSGG